VLRLIGLWTHPEDTDAFERDYLGAAFSRLGQLPSVQWSKTERCIYGPFFRMTEIGYRTLDELNEDIDSELGRELTEQARALADKYGIRLDVIVVADAS